MRCFGLTAWLLWLTLQTAASCCAALHPFGPNVLLFDPAMEPAAMNQLIQDVYEQQRFNEFGVQRYAFLFMPGAYGQQQAVDVRVGYYTQVLGLGTQPADVVIRGAVRTQDAPPGDPAHPEWGPGALTNFWRACENLSIIPTLGSLGYPEDIPKDQNVWAVSQAAPLRRVKVVDGSLRLYEMGWSSGGFLADSEVDGAVFSGTQQQWLTRNSVIGRWQGSNWNMVFCGVAGDIPAGVWPNPPYTVIEQTPVIRSKPYLIYDDVSGDYAVAVSPLRRDSRATDYSAPATVLPLSSFLVLTPDVTVAQINDALQQGKHLFFTPGVYYLDDTIRVTNPDTVVYGLGFPTLVPQNGKAALAVSDVDGVLLAGLMIDAGPLPSPTLLLVGETLSGVSHAHNPTFLFDIFCRVGGPSHPSQAQSCITINSNDVVGDNLWLWRADHGAFVGWATNTANNGITVNGNAVTIYNLMVEHFQKHQTVWNGDAGRVYHYQSEMPYDPPSQSAWKNGKSDGYASYKVGSNVYSHQAWGLGVYCYFRDAPVYAERAIEAPAGAAVRLQHMITFWLAGNSSSGIRRIVNKSGGAVSLNQRRSDLPQWP